MVCLLGIDIVNEQPCAIDDPLGGPSINGTCVTERGSGNLMCQPGDRRLSSMFLTCHVISGGQETTKGHTTTLFASASANFQDDAGAVAGGVIGALLGAALVAVAAVFLYRRYVQLRPPKDWLPVSQSP